MNATAENMQSSSVYSSPSPILPELPRAELRNTQTAPQPAQAPPIVTPMQFQMPSAQASAFRPAPMQPPQPMARVAQYYAGTPKPMPPQTRLLRVIQTVHNYDVGATSTMWEGEDGHIYLNTTVCVGEMVNVPQGR